MLNFSELSTQQVLALAISLEEEDVRIYTAYAGIYRERHPQSSRVFTAMAQEEDGHRHRLLEMYRRHFGEVLPLIRRQDVRGFVQRKPLWLQRALPLQKALRESQWMEEESRRFWSLFTIFSWGSQSPKSFRWRRAAQPILDVWASCATRNGAIWVTALRVAPSCGLLAALQMLAGPPARLCLAPCPSPQGGATNPMERS